jgi:hypothetical protein
MVRGVMPNSRARSEMAKVAAGWFNLESSMGRGK